MSNQRGKLISIEDLLLKAPLYREFAVNERDDVVKAILTFGKAVDTYCDRCKQVATFRGVVTQDVERLAKSAHVAALSPGVRFTPWSMRTFSKSLMCTREHAHVIQYHFVCEQEFVVKVGQYPSLADIEKGDTDKYEPALGRERLREFNRAIGLASHGVGIGAYTYLRRIFEGLVEESREAASKTVAGWDNAKYEQGWMADKVKMLHGFVPDFLASNPRLYAILSKGIHELTEQECLANFDALKLAIEVILDQRLRDLDHKDKEEAARKALARMEGQTTPKPA